MGLLFWNWDCKKKIYINSVVCPFYFKFENVLSQEGEQIVLM